MWTVWTGVELVLFQIHQVKEKFGVTCCTRERERETEAERERVCVFVHVFMVRVCVCCSCGICENGCVCVCLRACVRACVWRVRVLRALVCKCGPCLSTQFLYQPSQSCSETCENGYFTHI